MKFMLKITNGCFDESDIQDVKKLEKFGFTFEKTILDEEYITYINDNKPIIDIKNLGQVIDLINSLGRIIIDNSEETEYPIIEIYNDYRE